MNFQQKKSSRRSGTQTLGANGLITPKPDPRGKGTVVSPKSRDRARTATRC